MDKSIDFHVCVCVCVREREREREGRLPGGGDILCWGSLVSDHGEFSSVLGIKTSLIEDRSQSQTWLISAFRASFPTPAFPIYHAYLCLPAPEIPSFCLHTNSALKAFRSDLPSFLFKVLSLFLNVYLAVLSLCCGIQDL